MWKVYGNALMTADIDGTTKTNAMKVKMNADTVVRAVRTWFVFFNDPVYTELRFRLYEDQGGAAGKLIATSTNALTAATIFIDDATNTSAMKGVYFEFADVALKGTNFYHVLPYATGYTGDDSSHISWVKGWPDNEYRAGLTLSYEEIQVSPYRFAVIGADL